MTNKKIYILSFSGGKDSTALLFKLIQNKYPLDYIVFSDTGVEFPEMCKHINNIKSMFVDKFLIIKNKYSFIDYMTTYKRKRGKYKGLPYGFPTRKYRWCTKMLKIYPTKKFIKTLKGQVINYIGYSTDEIKRWDKLKKKEDDKVKYLAPLITDFEMNSKDTLLFSRSLGFTWGGLYKYMKRASCFLCPLQSKSSMFYLYKDRPELWSIIKELENGLKEKGVPYWEFFYGKSTDDLEKIFYKEW